jgi:hypothetical protein
MFTSVEMTQNKWINVTQIYVEHVTLRIVIWFSFYYSVVGVQNTNDFF